MGGDELGEGDSDELLGVVGVFGVGGEGTGLLGLGEGLVLCLAGVEGAPDGVQ